MAFTFQKAERKKAKLRLALCGPSGSGKTHSALLLASGLAAGGTIALIDTERGSACLEVGKSGIPEFVHGPLDPPYTPARYIEALRAAAEAGVAVVIVDSGTHAWAGEGGELDMVDKASKASRSGNTFAAWREVTPEHGKFVDAILAFPGHVIFTMRTKTEWEIQENERGKKTPIKIGLAPIQKAGMEYEFTAVLDLSLEGHIATASKDRTSLLDGKHEVPTAEMGRALLDWLESGADVPTKPAAIDKVTKLRELFDIAKRCGYVAADKDLVLSMARTAAGTSADMDTWTFEQWSAAREQIAIRDRWLTWCASAKALLLEDAIHWAAELGCEWRAPWYAEQAEILNSKMREVAA